MFAGVLFFENGEMIPRRSAGRSDGGNDTLEVEVGMWAAGATP